MVWFLLHESRADDWRNSKYAQTPKAFPLLVTQKDRSTDVWLIPNWQAAFQSSAIHTQRHKHARSTESCAERSVLKSDCSVPNFACNLALEPARPISSMEEFIWTAVCFKARWSTTSDCIVVAHRQRNLGSYKFSRSSCWWNMYSMPESNLLLLCLHPAMSGGRRNGVSFEIYIYIHIVV